MAFEQVGGGERSGGGRSRAFTDPWQDFALQSRRAGPAGGGSGGGVPSWMTTSQPGNISSQGASGLLPSSGIAGLETAVPGAIGAGGASGIPFAANLMPGLSQWLNPRTIAALAAAGGSALSGLRQPAGQSQLEDLFRLAMERSQSAGPLFDQMLSMTQAQMPAYTRGE